MDAESTLQNPYSQFAHTEHWAVLDRAVSELVKNSDLTESTSHEYVVGYLCKALAEPEVRKATSREELRQIIRAARGAVQAANPTNRDLLAELLAERRDEASRE